MPLVGVLLKDSLRHRFLSHILVASSVKFFSQEQPVIVHSARCIGKPYTQTPVCAGWSNISLEQCEAKCAQSLSPPNCPAHTPTCCMKSNVKQC